MDLGQNIRTVIEEDVEDEMTFMLVRSDVIGVDGNVVSHRRIGHDPLLEAKILGRMPSVEGADTGLEFLAIATGMHDFTDVKVQLWI